MIRSASLRVCLVWGIGTALGFCTACSAPSGDEAAPALQGQVAQPAQPGPNAASVAAGATRVAAALAVPSGTPAPAAKAAPAPAAALQVKRFVVATGVKDREPLTGGEPPLADGSAIYAFAELANPLGGSENVRITFERKGGAERVGNVTLPVPAQVSRHRTWAVTRFIRAPGVWDAVLWSESGAELGRTSFEVAASS